MTVLPAVAVAGGVSNIRAVIVTESWEAPLNGPVLAPAPAPPVEASPPADVN